MIRKLLLFVLLPLFCVGQAYAQQGVRVARASGEPLFVPLAQLSRMSFNGDLSAMNVEYKDGSVQQVMLADLGVVSFAPIYGGEAGIGRSGEVATSDITLSGNTLTVTSATPIRSAALYDAAGRLVGRAQGGEHAAQISLGTLGLSSGIYVVNIDTGVQRLTHKIVIP